MRKIRNAKGFTLIEVIVVIAVIAILAAILAPQIAKHIKDAKVAKARARRRGQQRNFQDKSWYLCPLQQSGDGCSR